jgi:hypothetical protein
MLSPNAGLKRRRYRKGDAKSTSYTSTVRVFYDGDAPHRVETLTPRRKLSRQATNGPHGVPGTVYPYRPPSPDGPFKCCNGKCFLQYQKVDDARVVEARAPYFDKAIAYPNKEALRLALHHQWTTTLLLDDGSPVCAIMACRIFGCSKSKLYADKRVRRKDPMVVATSIGSWFNMLKQTADVMPDEGWFQINAPLRKMVHDDYLEDCKTFGDTYVKCSIDYFNKVWRENYSNVRLRKHCRFAKCTFCVRWRSIYEKNDKQRNEAFLKLKEHRAWANIRERAHWQAKRNTAIHHPDEAISLSLDGTDKVLHHPSSLIITRKTYAPSPPSTPHPPTLRVT